jgi:hypothetical protein
MWSALASILLGVFGWVIPKLLIEPGKEIFDLRREAQECMIVYGNLSPEAPADERRTAAEAFRRVGSGLVSRHTAAFRWVTWWYERRLHWDINSAGALLIGLGNATQSEGFSYANLSSNVTLIRQCLRLRTPEQPSMIRAMMENAAQPRPMSCRLTRRHVWRDAARPTEARLGVAGRSNKWINRSKNADAATVSETVVFESHSHGTNPLIGWTGAPHAPHALNIVYVYY